MASIRQIVQDVLYEARGCSAHGLCLRSNRHFLGCTRYVSYCFCFFRYRFSLLSAGPDSFSCTSDRHGRRFPTLHRKGPVGRLQSSSDGSGFPVCGASRPHEHGFRRNRLLSLQQPGGLVQHFEDPLYLHIGGSGLPPHRNILCLPPYVPSRPCARYGCCRLTWLSRCVPDGRSRCRYCSI